MTAPTPPKLYLIDGSGYIFRAFFALPSMLRPDGVPVSAVYGFTSMLMKLIEETDTNQLAVIFDTGRVSFRTEIYPEYKAHRPPMPPELVPQFPLIREVTRAFNLPAIELAGFEADDLIATYATQAAAKGIEVVILSSDKDFMQLVTDKVTLFDPIKNKVIDSEGVREKFGVAPDKVIDVQALCGDSSDNVPGVHGIGVKIAAELITAFGSLEALLARIDEITQPKRRETLRAQADMARLSQRLVRLRRDVPLPVALDDLTRTAPDPEVLRDFLAEQGFHSLIARLNRKLDSAQPSKASQAAQGPETRYQLIQDIASLKHWIEAANHQGLMAFDTETSSLDAVQAELVGISLATGAGQACYIPVGHVAPGKAADSELDLAQTAPPLQIPLTQALELLAPLLQDPAVLKIGHNIKYDIQVLASYGIEVTPIDDTMILSHLLDGARHGHGMDALAALHLGHETIKYKDVAGSGKSHVGFARVSLDRALAYAAEDADITFRLHQKLKPRLVREQLVSIYETLERPLPHVVSQMERAGIKVDAASLIRLSGEFTARMAALEAEIHARVGRAFNVASPKQLGNILFEEMKLLGGKRGKNGDYSTDSSILEPLAEEGHVLPAQILDYRQLAKLKSTYTDTLIEQINPATGRVHTSFSLAATSTGRLSSSDPNLQNIPIRTEEGRKIREAFIAEPGHRLLSIDYSQIELRLLAELADIAALKLAFRQGLDIHAATASQVFGIPLDQLDSETRRKAKAVNFGIIYGISAFGLARQLGCSPKDAKHFIEAYFERYPGIKTYMEATKAAARDQGYVSTLFGRKCFVPGIADKNAARRGFAERQAINAPLQGTAADIIKRAMIRIPASLAKAGLAARMLLQVHDELLFEAPDAEIDQTAALVVKIMESAASLSIPLVAKAGVGLTWGQAH